MPLLKGEKIKSCADEGELGGEDGRRTAEEVNESRISRFLRKLFVKTIFVYASDVPSVINELNQRHIDY